MKYADVVSGDEGITMMLRVTGGFHARIEAPMLIFQNPNFSYPIRGVPHDFASICYRSGGKGWMGGRVSVEWLAEPRAIRRDIYGRNRTHFFDSWAGHIETEAVSKCLRDINTVLRKLPADATDRVQPADSFVISILKDAWRTR